MCSWKVQGVQPLDKSDPPIFDTDFYSHMMKGDRRVGSHSGLHSMNLLLAHGDTYQIKEGNKILDSNFPQVYSAKVGLIKNADDLKNRQATPKYYNEKLSSFFPDSMTFKEIEKAVIFAYQNFKGSSQGLIRRQAKHNIDYNTGLARVSYDDAKHDAIHAFGRQLMRLKVSDTGGIKWAGRVKISNGGAESWVIWIGSPQTGSTSSKLLTAFLQLWGNSFKKFL